MARVLHVHGSRMLRWEDGDGMEKIVFKRLALPEAEHPHGQGRGSSQDVVSPSK